MRENKEREEILAILGDVLEDFGTGRVLTTPSDSDSEAAIKVIDEFTMDPVVRDLAILTAQHYGDVLQSKGLRPSDFSHLSDIPDKLFKALTKRLRGKGKPYFIEVFKEHLGYRG